MRYGKIRRDRFKTLLTRNVVHLQETVSPSPQQLHELVTNTVVAQEQRDRRNDIARSAQATAGALPNLSVGSNSDYKTTWIYYGI
jgi:hypothetical protein